MDGTQLFWATGIDNSKLKMNAQEAINIFRSLSANVKIELNAIRDTYKEMQNVANVKFANPVDIGMVKSIESQVASLEAVINKQINSLASWSMSYDKAIEKIKKSSDKIGKNGVPDPLKGTVENVKRSVAETGNQLNFLEKRFKQAFATLIAYGSFTGASEFVKSIIQVSGQFDQLRVAINSFVGDAEKGMIVFNQLTSLAVKSPFQLMEITDSAKQLLAYGVAAKDVTESVKRLSDVSAGSGQSIRDISYLYGTSLTQGRLYARDLFQFANRGIPIYKEIAKVMGGISTSQLMDQVKAGKVGFNELSEAIENMTNAGGLYFGLSDKLAETNYGKISNLKDRWQLALDEIGQANKGFISEGVELTTAMIDNWEGIARAIESVVIAYGAYKAATVVGGLMLGAESYAMYAQQAIQLEALVSVEAKAAMAKQGLTIGTAEYVAALRAETAAKLSAAIATVEGLDVEIAAQKAALLSKRELIAASTQRIVVLKAEQNAAIAAGNLNAFYAAEEEIQTLSKDVNTAATERQTLSRQIKAGVTQRDIAAETADTMATNLNTATARANAASTNVLTAAKIRLTAAVDSLNAFMAANPGLVLVGIFSALAAAVWYFHDSTTAAEKALKKFNDQQKITEDMAQRQKDAVQENIGIIRSGTAGRIEEGKAMAELQRILPDVFKNMDIEMVKRQNINKEIRRGNDLIDLSKIKKEKAAKVDAETLLNQKKLELAAAEAMPIDPMSGGLGRSTTIAGIQKEIDTQESLIKKYDESIKAQEEMATIAKAAASEVVKNKEYYKELLDTALAARDAMEPSQKGGDKWNQLTKDIKNYRSILKTWEDDKEATVKTGEGRSIRRHEEFAKKLLDIDVSTEASRQLIVRESYEKSEALMNLEHKKALSAIEKQRIELIAKARQVGVAVSPTGVVSGDSTDSKKTVDALANLNEQKRNQEEKYSNSRIELERKTQEEIDKINYDAFKSFDSDLNKQLASIAEKYRKLRLDIEKNAETSQIEPMKTVVGMAEKTEIEKAYSDKKKTIIEYEYQTQSEVNSIRNESAAFGVTRAQEEINIEVAKNEALLEENKRYLAIISRNMLEVSGNDKLDVAEKKKILDSLKSQASTYEEINSKIKVSLSLLEFKGKKQQLSDLGASFSQIGGELADIGEVLKDVDEGFTTSIISAAEFAMGIGESATKIIEDVEKLSTTTIDSITGAATVAGKAVSTVEKASVILAIISTALQVTQKIKDMISNEEFNAYKLQVEQSRLDLQHKYNEALIKQKTIQKELFGGDKYNNALKYADGYYSALDAYDEKYTNGVFVRIKKVSTFWSKAFSVLSPASMIGGASGLIEDALKKTEMYTVNARQNMEIVTEKAKKGFFGIGGSHTKKQNLEEWLKQQGYGDLFDKDGNLNLTLAETVYDMEELTAETKKFLGELIDSTKLINEMNEGLDTYINETFGSLGDAMTNAIVDAFRNGTDAAEQFRTDINAVLEDVGAQMIRSLFLQEIIQNYSDTLKGIYKKQRTGTDQQNADAIAKEVASATSEYFGSLTEAQRESTDWLEQYKKMAAQYGFDLYAPTDEATTGNATSNAIKAITQDQADFLSAQASAMRINISDIRIDVSKILLNLSSSQLIMANQTNILEIAFQDVHEIAINTRTLFDIKKSLSDIYINGLKVK